MHVSALSTVCVLQEFLYVPAVKLSAAPVCRKTLADRRINSLQQYFKSLIWYNSVHVHVWAKISNALKRPGFRSRNFLLLNSLDATLIAFPLSLSDTSSVRLTFLFPSSDSSRK